MVEYKKILYWMGKLKTFNWETDRPTTWQCCKPGMKITFGCVFLSIIMAVCVAVTNNGEFWISAFCLGGGSLLLGVFTVFILWQVNLVLNVLKYISPESIFIHMVNKVKNNIIICGVCCSLGVIGIGTVVSPFFVFFSGDVFSVAGLMFSIIFSSKVDRIIPKEFISALRTKYLQCVGGKPDGFICCSKGEGYLPVNVVSNGFIDGQNSGSVNNLFYFNGDVYENNNMFGVHEYHPEMKIESSIHDFYEHLSPEFNPASGLPMVNEAFDINGDAFGTTSHFHDEHHWDHYWDHHYDSHRWDDRW